MRSNELDDTGSRTDGLASGSPDSGRRGRFARGMVAIVVPTAIAVRRLRKRPVAYLGLAIAIGAAASLVGWSGVRSALAHERFVDLRLEEVPHEERAVQIVYHVPVGATDSYERTTDQFFRRFAAVLTAPRRVAIWHSVGDGTRIAVVQDPLRDVVLTSGRLPRACTTTTCEMLSLRGGHRLGERLALEGGAFARIVGHGYVDPEALPEAGRELPPTPDLGSEALLAAELTGPLVRATRFTGSSVVTTATLSPSGVHGATLRQLERQLTEATVRIERQGPLIQAAAPIDLLDELSDRGDVARDRLLLVSGEGGALIIAFAAFVAAARRREYALLSEQLTGLAATRWQRAVTRTVEVIVPSIVGTAFGLGVLVVSVEVVRARNDLPAAFRSAALPTATLVAIVVLATAASLLLALSLRPQRARRLGAFELAAVAAFAVLVWQGIVSGGLDSERIAAGEGSGPFLFLVPALALFVTAVLLLRLIPPALVLAERGARRAPLSVRLALVNAARHPADVAAVTTFLAVALGAGLFALNYRATLNRQTANEAAFRAGADWRVVEGAPQESSSPGRERVGSDITPITVVDAPALSETANATPLSRYERALSERPTAAIRFSGSAAEASEAGEETEIEVLGIPARSIPLLAGWQTRFAKEPREELAGRLNAGRTQLTGLAISHDADELKVRMRADDVRFERFVTLHFLRPDDQTFVHVRLGLLSDQFRTLRLPVRKAMRGAHLVGIEFPPLSVTFGGVDSDMGSIEIAGFSERRRGRWRQLASLDGWTAADTGTGGGSTGMLERGADLDRFRLRGTALPLIRPEIPAVVPAVVGPALEGHAVDGRLKVVVNSREVLFDIVGQADLFPTVTEHPSAFLVADYDALFARLNADFPGAAAPTETWFFSPPPATLEQALSSSLFRPTRVIRKDALESRLAHDPLARGTHETLGVAALAAAALALLGLLLGARSSLAVQRTLHAEYEALGVRPATLARSNQIHFAAIAALGIVAAIVGALLALRLVGGLVAVTGGGGEPLTPIVAIVAWDVTILTLTAVGVVGVLATAFFARRTRSQTAATRLRA